MHLASCGDSLLYGFAYVHVRSGGGDSYALGLGFYGRLGSHPDDVPDLHVVGVDRLLSGFNVDGCSEARIVKTEVVQPGAVLPPFVAVVLVLGRGLYVSDEENYSFAALCDKLVEKGLAPSYIYFFCKQFNVV